MGIAISKHDGAEFGFERSGLLGRVLVDFDPGPDLNVGFYSEEEFALTFDVVSE
jgi:hypothetical protein